MHGSQHPQSLGLSIKVFDIINSQSMQRQYSRVPMLRELVTRGEHNMDTMALTLCEDNRIPGKYITIVFILWSRMCLYLDAGTSSSMFNT